MNRATPLRLSPSKSLSQISCDDTFNGNLVYLALQLGELLLVRLFAIERCGICRVLIDLRHENFPLATLHVDQSNLESDTDYLCLVRYYTAHDGDPRDVLCRKVPGFGFHHAPVHENPVNAGFCRGKSQRYVYSSCLSMDVLL